MPSARGLPTTELAGCSAQGVCVQGPVPCSCCRCSGSAGVGKKRLLGRNKRCVRGGSACLLSGAGCLLTSGTARACAPRTASGGGRASKGNLPAPGCYRAPKINLSESDVMPWLQNALTALLGSPAGLCSSSRSIAAQAPSLHRCVFGVSSTLWS